MSSTVLSAHLHAVYVDLAMYSMSDLQKILGLSRRQVHARLSALYAVPGLLDGEVRKGPRGRKEYSIGVLQMLRDLEALSVHPGVTLGQAAVQVAKRIRGDGDGNGNAERTGGTGQGVQVNAEVVEALQAHIRSLEDEVRFLRERLIEVQQLALPRPWWAWWKR